MSFDPGAARGASTVSQRELTGIECDIHRVVTEKLGHHLVEQQSLEDIFRNPEARQNLVLNAVAEAMGRYGTAWVGTGAPGYIKAADIPDSLGEFLSRLAGITSYVSLHLFDVFDDRRRSIASVVPGIVKPSWSSDYVAIETLYKQLDPTLVAWMHQLSRETGHLSLALDTSSSGSVPFPREYCANVFQRIGWNQHDVRDIDVDEAKALLRAERNEPFAKRLMEELALATLSPEDAAAIALALYLWEHGLPEVGILPYYVRLFAWDLPPTSSEASVPKQPVIGGLSCTFKKDVPIDENDFLRIDALSRGIAGAVALFGLQLARILMTHVQLPSMYKHELGQAIGQLIEQLLSKKLAKDYLLRELSYVDFRLTEIADDVSIGRPRGQDDTQIPENPGAWLELFADMCKRGAPPMENVTLVSEMGAVRTECRLGGSNVRRHLSRFAWPTASMKFRRYHLRTILTNLIYNAQQRAAANRIEIRFIIADQAGYVDLFVWDDGRPMLTKEVAEDNQTGRFGLRIIKNTLERLHGELEIPYGKGGLEKVFRIRIPVVVASQD